MDIQDFVQQGEGPQEDKMAAWNFFQEAYECQMKGNLEEALKLYQNSIDTFPSAEAYTFLGWTYSFMGQLHEAIEECHSVISRIMARLADSYLGFKVNAVLYDSIARSQSPFFS